MINNIYTSLYFLILHFCNKCFTSDQDSASFARVVGAIALGTAHLCRLSSTDASSQLMWRCCLSNGESPSLFTLVFCIFVYVMHFACLRVRRQCISPIHHYSHPELVVSSSYCSYSACVSASNTYPMFTGAAVIDRDNSTQKIKSYNSWSVYKHYYNLREPSVLKTATTERVMSSRRTTEVLLNHVITSFENTSKWEKTAA